MPLIVALTFVLGFFGGDMLHRQSGPTPAQKKFQTILNLIKNDYVDEISLDSLHEKTQPKIKTKIKQQKDKKTNRTRP